MTQRLIVQSLVLHSMGFAALHLSGSATVEGAGLSHELSVNNVPAASTATKQPDWLVACLPWTSR